MGCGRPRGAAPLAARRGRQPARIRSIRSRRGRCRRWHRPSWRRRQWVQSRAGEGPESGQPAAAVAVAGSRRRPGRSRSPGHRRRRSWKRRVPPPVGCHSRRSPERGQTAGWTDRASGLRGAMIGALVSTPPDPPIVPPSAGRWYRVWRVGRFVLGLAARRSGDLGHHRQNRRAQRRQHLPGPPSLGVRGGRPGRRGACPTWPTPRCSAGCCWPARSGSRWPDDRHQPGRQRHPELPAGRGRLLRRLRVPPVPPLRRRRRAGGMDAGGGERPVVHRPVRAGRGRAWDWRSAPAAPSTWSK